MHFNALKKRNKATHCYLITLALWSRGPLELGTCYMLAPIQKIRKNGVANLFTNSETMDNGHWKFHQQWMLMLVTRVQITQPLVTKRVGKNHQTSQHKKTCNPSSQKITQTLAQKKSCNLLAKKKSCNLTAKKNLMQPLTTKRNHATSWRKKKSRNLLAQKKESCNLDAKKKSLNLLAQKKIT